MLINRASKAVGTSSEYGESPGRTADEMAKARKRKKLVEAGYAETWILY